LSTANRSLGSQLRLKLRVGVMRAIISLANASVIASVLTMSSSSGYAITFFVGHCCSVCLVFGALAAPISAR
jgi:hypothetical protein